MWSASATDSQPPKRESSNPSLSNVSRLDLAMTRRKPGWKRRHLTLPWRIPLSWNDLQVPALGVKDCGDWNATIKCGEPSALVPRKAEQI